MFSLESFKKEYEADSTEVKIGGRQFQFLVPRSLDKFVDSQNIFHKFPLWAKIWKASLILADHIAVMTVKPKQDFLEIGSGIGLVGIVAASFGHQVTITEYDDHALNFARANALVNHCSNLEVKKLDWNKPGMQKKFDYIIGSEVVYDEGHFQPLMELFVRLLKPEGEVILSAEMRRTNMEFFDQMQKHFQIKAQKKRLHSEGQEVSVILCRILNKGRKKN
ncbi:methyltransferase [Thermodesulfobacteriota bacterium]